MVNVDYYNEIKGKIGNSEFSPLFIFTSSVDRETPPNIFKPLIPPDAFRLADVGMTHFRVIDGLPRHLSTSLGDNTAGRDATGGGRTAKT